MLMIINHMEASNTMFLFQGIESDGHEGCSAECARRPQCNYWTFVSKWRVNCYLKSRLGEAVEYEAISGTYGSLCGEWSDS